MSDTMSGSDCLMEDLLKEAEGYLDSDTEKALTFYEQVVEESPEDFRGYVGLAHCYSRLRKMNRAVENAEKALELNPQSAGAYQGLAYAALERNQNEKALIYAHKAYELDPDSYHSHLFYGRANFKMGNYGRVSEFYEQALALRPDDVRLRRDLITSYAKTERWEKARSEAEVLWKMQPSIWTWMLRTSTMPVFCGKFSQRIFGLFIVVGLFVLLWVLLLSLPLILLGILEALCIWRWVRAIIKEKAEEIILFSFLLFELTYVLLYQLGKYEIAV